MERNRALMGAVALALGSLAVSARAEPGGESFRELSAQWWQWVYSTTPTSNPIVDQTGAYCMTGQRGPIWFLAGSFGSTVQRTCNVPEGVALFFPVLNNFWVNTPGCSGEPVYTPNQLRALVAPFIDTATQLSVELDSRPVRDIRRVKSAVFPMAFASDYDFGCSVGGKVFSPSVDDGYYTMIRGLGVGQHKLRIRSAASGFSLDVSYTLNVVKVVQ